MCLQKHLSIVFHPDYSAMISAISFIFCLLLDGDETYYQQFRRSPIQQLVYLSINASSFTMNQKPQDSALRVCDEVSIFGHQGLSNLIIISYTNIILIRILLLTSICSLNDMPDIMKQMPPLPVKMNDGLANIILPPPPHPMQC